MTCVVTSVTFLFLLATIGAETISFLTSYMVVNRYAPGLHDGIFQRCGAINFFLTAINSIGSFVSKHLDGTVDTFTSCYWWNSSLFRKDESKFFDYSSVSIKWWKSFFILFYFNLGSLQAVIIFTFISIGLLALAFILFLISLVNRFRTKQLNLFLGLLMLFNCN